MTNGDDLLRTSFEKELVRFEKSFQSLPGIADPSFKEVFIEQAVESVHRVKYVRTILDRDISPTRIDPHNPLFDPIRAAIYYFKNDEVVVVASERHAIQTTFNIPFDSVHELKPGFAMIIKKDGRAEEVC